MRIQHNKYVDDRTATDRTATETLAIALGWFSVALGAAEMFAPRQVARLIGIAPSDGTTTTLRAYGARELANGLAILSEPGEAKWLWSRVGGDALDLASLGAAAGRDDAERTRVAMATAAVAGVTVLDVLAAIGLTASHRGSPEFPAVDEQAVTINAPLEAVENGWIEWCATGHAKLKNNYAIRFEPAPGARGTEVHLSRGGSAGTIREELRRFKQRVETGEIPLSDGPGLSRPSRPRPSNELENLAEVE